ncbi:MAG: hypothetical protein GXY32_02815 [Ruminococcaceae bacterium]|nr:hypothetical protein [Oscillospiraceae bacterium]
MTVHLKFRSMDLEAMTGAADVPNGATVEQAVNQYLAAQGAELSGENLRQSMILVNRMAVRADQVLQDGDEVMVLRSVEAG